MKKITALVLAFILCLTSFGALDFEAAAAYDWFTAISEGTTWRDSWTVADQTSSVSLNVTQTGFYTFTFTDHKQTGLMYAMVYDHTLESGVVQGFCSNLDNNMEPVITASYTTREVYLLKDHEYEIQCAYGDYETLLDADMSIVCNRSDVMVNTIPTDDSIYGTSNKNGISVSFSSADATEWLYYRSDAEGDYTLHFDPFSAYISVFEVATGKPICDSRTTECLSEGTVRTKLVFHLAADTEYYVLIQAYGQYNTTKLAFAPNLKTVKNIVPYGLAKNIYFYENADTIDYSFFSFSIRYTDGTGERISNASLEMRGYTLPTIVFQGESDHVLGMDCLRPGEQPVLSIYEGQEYHTTVPVLSITKYFAYETTMTLTYPDSYGVIYHEDSQEHTRVWRIKASMPANYTIAYNTEPYNDSFDANFEYYRMDMVDSQNRVVPFNNQTKTWTLDPSDEYVLIITYKYKRLSYDNDIGFWLTAKGAIEYGWHQSDGKWYFYEYNQVVKNAWRKDWKGWCYLGPDGAMLTNAWVRDSVGWCYVGANGYAVTNCWKKDSVGWCYLNSEGSMTKNEWLNDGGKWYYLDGNGYMVANKWMRDGGGNWLYLGTSGAMVTNGWAQDSSGWLWMDANGCITRSKWIKDGGKWYYLDANGYMVANKWMKDSKGWVYLGSSGAMLTNAWCKDSIGWCYVGADGYAVTNCWKKDSVGWCYLNSEGSMTKSKWIKDGGEWYYLDADGYMVTDTWEKDSSGWHYINSDGCLESHELDYHDHVFEAATLTKPQTCSCGATRGKTPTFSVEIQHRMPFYHWSADHTQQLKITRLDYQLAEDERSMIVYLSAEALQDLSDGTQPYTVKIVLYADNQSVATVTWRKFLDVGQKVTYDYAGRLDLSNWDGTGELSIRIVN